MRKVTASAVILTAITGCSQSEVPSSNWSFDDPTNQRFDTAFSTREGESEDLIKAFGSGYQAFIAQGDGTLMGPAFEQPIVAAESTPSEQASTLADAAALVDRDDASASSGVTRSDPLATVRSYLNATSSISGIGNRVPFSSQVYLPAAPTYGTSSGSSENVVALPLVEAPLATGRGVDASQSVANLATDATEDLASGSLFVGASDHSQFAQPQSVASAASLFNPDVSSVPFSAESVAGVPQTSALAGTISPAEERYVSNLYVEARPSDSDFIEERVVDAGVAQPTQPVASQDSLPVLEHAPLASDLLAFNETDSIEVDSVAEPSGLVSSVTDLSSEAPVSLGTSLLQTLASNGDPEARAALAAAEVASETVAVTTEDSVEATLETEASSGTVEISTGQTLGVEPSEPISAGQQPTLEELLASMPRRDGAPIITEFEIAPRDSQQISIVSDGASGEVSDGESRSGVIAEPSTRPIPSFKPLPLELPLPAGLLPNVPTEAPTESVPAELGSAESEGMESVQSEAVRDSSTASHRLRPEGYRSPLLEGLEADSGSTVALSTIYVPIPEAPTADVSALLILEAISAISNEALSVGTGANPGLSANGLPAGQPNNYLSVLEDIAEQSFSEHAAYPASMLVRFGDSSRAISLAAPDSALKQSAASGKRLPAVSSRRQSVMRRQRIVWQ